MLPMLICVGKEEMKGSCKGVVVRTYQELIFTLPQNSKYTKTITALGSGIDCTEKQRLHPYSSSGWLMSGWFPDAQQTWWRSQEQRPTLISCYQHPPRPNPAAHSPATSSSSITVPTTVNWKHHRWSQTSPSNFPRANVDGLASWGTAAI